MKTGSLDIRNWRQKNCRDLGLGFAFPSWYGGALAHAEFGSGISRVLDAYRYFLERTECVRFFLNSGGFGSERIQAWDPAVAGTQSLQPRGPCVVLAPRKNVVSTLWPPLPSYGSGSLAKHVRNIFWLYKWGCGYSYLSPVHPKIILIITVTSRWEPGGNHCSCFISFLSFVLIWHIQILWNWGHTAYKVLNSVFFSHYIEDTFPCHWPYMPSVILTPNS